MIEEMALKDLKAFPRQMYRGKERLQAGEPEADAEWCGMRWAARGRVNPGWRRNVEMDWSGLTWIARLGTRRPSEAFGKSRKWALLTIT